MTLDKKHLTVPLRNLTNLGKRPLTHHLMTRLVVLMLV
jgi:hypothetical protein